MSFLALIDNFEILFKRYSFSSIILREWVYLWTPALLFYFAPITCFFEYNVGFPQLTVCLVFDDLFSTTAILTDLDLKPSINPFLWKNQLQRLFTEEAGAI